MLGQQAYGFRAVTMLRPQPPSLHTFVVPPVHCISIEGRRT